MAFSSIVGRRKPGERSTRLLSPNEDASLSVLSRDFALTVAAANHLFDEGLLAVSDQLVGIAACQLNLILREYDDLEGGNLVPQVTSVEPLGLDDLIPKVRERLVNHYGLESAERWLSSPNPVWGNRVPGVLFRDESRQHDFLDATCDWPLEETGRFPKVVTEGSCRA
jgi:hypothetical protein